MDTTNHWMVVMSPDNYEKEINSLGFNLLGLPRRYRDSIKKMKKKDKVLYYINTISCFAAIAEVVGEPYYDNNERLWIHAHETYPNRIKIKPLIFLEKDCLLSVKSIINEIEFVKNKDKWMVFFQGSFRQIPEMDYLYIEGLMKKSKR